MPATRTDPDRDSRRRGRRTPGTTRSSSRSRARCSASTGPSSASPGTSSSSAPSAHGSTSARSRSRPAHGLDATRGGRHGHRSRVPSRPRTVTRALVAALRAAYDRGARAGVVLQRRVRARGSGRARRPARRRRTGCTRRGSAAEYPADRRASPTSSTSTTVRADVGGHRRRRSTCRCTSCAATTAARSRTPSPAAWWCHRIATAVRRSSSTSPCPTPAMRHTLGPTLDWIVDNLAEPLTVEQMAAHALMSSPDVHAPVPRRDRHDTAALAARSNASRTRASSSRRTDVPIDRVAQVCGFGTAANLRVHFLRTVGTPPTSYRRTFRPERRLSELREAARSGSGSPCGSSACLIARNARELRRLIA